MASIAGLAGGVAGLGLDLLFQVEDEKLAVAIPTLTATGGLITGAALAEGRDPGSTGRHEGTSNALLELEDGPRVGLPFPEPAAVRVASMTGEWRSEPAVRFRLFQAHF